uniref:RRAD and GEM like GTPase 2 n=1 Tax=Pelusios castaneus TaxID=367368 RepID=A0A8C8RU42_9SAUR
PQQGVVGGGGKRELGAGQGEGRGAGGGRGEGDHPDASHTLSPAPPAPPTPWRCPRWRVSGGQGGAACPCPPSTSCGGRRRWRSWTHPPSLQGGLLGDPTAWCWRARAAWARRRWPGASPGCGAPLLRTICPSEAGTGLQESCVQSGDAFLLVFSVADRRSFSRVPTTLLRLRTGSPRPDPPVILVGNKSDLARAREVSLEEGRSLAVMLSCKHIETSAVLHHNTQELFEGAVRQIRLRRRHPVGDREPSGAPTGRRESLTKKAKRFLSGLVPRNGRFFKQRSKSCNDLSVL